MANRAAAVRSRQVVERRQQLALRQVAGRAEDHHDARVAGRVAVFVDSSCSSMLIPLASGRPFDVAAELVAHRGEHLFGERVLLPRAEARVERRGQSTSAGTASSIAA